MRKPIMFAFRGGRGEGDENTLGAFRRALALGADGIESDARLAGDGQPVLVAAAAVRAGLRLRRVDTFPAERLAGHGIPRLSDVYRDLDPCFELSLDVREAAVVPAVLAVAREHGALSRLWLRSTELELLSGARAIEESVRLVHTMGRRAYGDGLERHAADLAAGGVTALSLRDGDWSKGLVALIRRFGLLAFAAQARENRRLRALLEMGVDGISSDQVERLVAAVGEWSG